MSSATTPILPAGLGTVLDEHSPGFSFTFFKFNESYGDKLSVTFTITTNFPVLDDIPEGNTGVFATINIPLVGSVSKEFVRTGDVIAPLVTTVTFTFAGVASDARVFNVLIDGAPEPQASFNFGIASVTFIVTNDYPDSALSGIGSFSISADWGPTRLFTPSNTINCPTAITFLGNTPNNPFSGGNLFLVHWTNSATPGNGVMIFAKPVGIGGDPIPVAYTTTPAAGGRGFTLMPSMAEFATYFQTDRNWEITLRAIQADAVNPNNPFLISEDSISDVTFVETIADLVIVGGAAGIYAAFGGVGSGNGTGVVWYPTPPVGAIPNPILLADPSGIYTIVPGLLHDVLYNRNGDEKINIAIPTPFARTAFLGE